MCVIYVLRVSCFRVCSLLPCCHLLGKVWPLGSCLRCIIVILSLFHVVSWGRFGTLLYCFLIFAVFLASRGFCALFWCMLFSKHIGCRALNKLWSLFEDIYSNIYTASKDMHRLYFCWNKSLKLPWRNFIEYETSLYVVKLCSFPRHAQEGSLLAGRPVSYIGIHLCSVLIRILVIR